jgi:predicted transcriptional regulator YdeE
MTLIKDEPGDVARLWRLLDVELGGTAPAGRYYGIASRPRAPGEGYFYFAGVEVGGDPVRGPNLVVRALPSARYARFVHKGPRERRELTLGYIRHTWIPRSGHALAYPMEIELYVELPRRFGDEEAETPLLVPL